MCVCTGHMVTRFYESYWWMHLVIFCRYVFYIQRAPKLWSTTKFGRAHIEGNELALIYSIYHLHVCWFTVGIRFHMCNLLFLIYFRWWVQHFSTENPVMAESEHKYIILCRLIWRVEGLATYFYFSCIAFFIWWACIRITWCLLCLVDLVYVHTHCRHISPILFLDTFPNNLGWWTINLPVWLWSTINLGIYHRVRLISSATGLYDYYG
jgi:hypothetical protein